MDVVEEIKQRLRIEDIILEDGFDLQGSGRYLRGIEHDSLVVDTARQMYFWNSRNEWGDVFAWVMNRRGWDFLRALEELARRAGVSLVSNDAERQHMKSRREQEKVLALAAEIMHEWLWEDREALNYARGRGWDNDVLREALLGFTGREKSSAQVMRQRLEKAGLDPECPAAVAVLGFRGDVAGWAKRYHVRPLPHWVQQGYIPGLLGRKRLVYPHLKFGRVVYLSARNILGDDAKVKAYNPPRALLGPRQPYFNHVYHWKAKEVVLVEGQADAISLGVWGVPGVALAGTVVDQNLARYLTQRHPILYVALDRDRAGQQNREAVAEILGPLTRLLEWPGPDQDANDLLKAWMSQGVPLEEQQQRIRDMLNQAEPYLLLMAQRAGKEDGPQRDILQRQVALLLQRLTPLEQAQYRSRVAKAMGIGIRDLKAMVKALQNGSHEDADEEEEEFTVKPIVGGYIEGHLIELMYDPKEDKTSFAVRFPDGRIEVRREVTIDKVKYVPIPPDDAMRKSVVLLPSDLPEPLPLRELVERIRTFIHKYVDVDEFYERIATYYALFTWVYDSFRVVPYLRALGDYGTGKSRLIETVGSLCYRAIFTFGATTVSPIFRLLDMYRGTLVLDEADYQQSDEAVMIIKLLNAGYKENATLMRAKDLGGGKGYGVEVFNVYSPKIIATRRRFADHALESRCLTKEMGGTLRPDIPIVLPRGFWDEARELRNFLLAYRMHTWRPKQDVDYNEIDRSIEPRLNQVISALKTLIDDEKLRQEIDDFIREYNRQLVTERSMTLTAKVLEALVRIRSGPPAAHDKNGNPVWDLTLSNIARVTNALIDRENAELGEDEEIRPKAKVSARKVGHIVRTHLRLKTERRTESPFTWKIMVIWNEEYIRGACARYGVPYPPGPNGHKPDALQNPTQADLFNGTNDIPF